MITRRITIALDLVTAACVLTATARAQLHQVRLTVSLSDSAVPAVPVPNFILMIYRSTGEATPVVTDQHGTAAPALAAGDYRVVSFQSYAWRGRRFSWSVPLSVHGDSVALELTAANAGSSSAPGAGWPPVAHKMFPTPSGRPEVVIPGVSKRAVMDALVAVTANDGWWFRSASEYQVVVSQPTTGIGAVLLGVLIGSASDQNPEWRAFFSVVETGAGVRVIGYVLFVRSPGSAFEHSDDVTENTGQQLQAMLDQLRISLVAQPPAAPRR